MIRSMVGSALSATSRKSRWMSWYRVAVVGAGVSTFSWRTILRVASLTFFAVPSTIFSAALPGLLWVAVGRHKIWD